MKSTIDWNEIIPRLPKELRDSLYLEAISLLSDLTTGESIEIPEKSRRKTKLSKAILPRDWRKEGDGFPIGKPGRKFTINKVGIAAIQAGSANGSLWKKVEGTKLTYITVEELTTIIGTCPDIRSANDGIWYLWSRRCLDVVSP